MDFGFQFARDQAAAIARDRVAHMPPEQKAELLRLTDAVLELWKTELVQPDGTIVIEPVATGLLGLQYSAPGLTLAEMASINDSKRVPAKDLRPEQCAGPFVRSRSDLFLQLWGEKYPPVETLTSLPGVRADNVVALLVEADSESMGADSLAKGIRHIWMFVWEIGKIYRELLVERDASEVAKLDQLANARAVSATKRAKEREERDNAMWELAVEINIREVFPKADYVARRVYERVKDKEGFEGHTEKGIRERIKGAKEEAQRRLRSQPPQSG